MLRTFIDTNVGDSRWRPPLVDEDWHAACQLIYCKFVEPNKADNVCHTSGNNRAKTLSIVTEAEEKGDAYYDQTSEQQIVSLDMVRQASWDTHLQNPTIALDEALRRVAALDNGDSRTVGGSRS